MTANFSKSTIQKPGGVQYHFTPQGGLHLVTPQSLKQSACIYYQQGFIHNLHAEWDVPATLDVFDIDLHERKLGYLFLILATMLGARETDFGTQKH